MKITIRGKNVEVTEGLRDYVEKKLAKLTRYFDHIHEAQVTVFTERGSYVAEVTIPLNSMILRGEEGGGENLYAAVDQVTDKLEKQVQKYRAKLYRRFRNQGLKDLITALGEENRKDEEPKVVRTKRFAMKPMPVEEAILQMNLLGHDFFVFRDAETEQVNVLYRRKDGNYGLIEPEF
ncbi:MAG: ribosome-associated translation inhibitor RaiA [Bacillota bacterium]|nr:ribosome-associated translation inhibitor RaiA [Bacillota bacterium]